MREVEQVMQQWQLDVRTVRDLLYQAVTPRERERWHALWLLAQGWSAARVADALDRDPHTIGDWLADFRRAGPAGLAFEATGGSPPRSEQPSKRR